MPAAPGHVSAWPWGWGCSSRPAARHKRPPPEPPQLTERPTCRPPAASTADCDYTTCYTPQQLETAYGVQPLLQRGIDGRGETVVLPELAETQLNPPQVTDLRQDFAAYDRLFHLPARASRS